MVRPVSYTHLDVYKRQHPSRRDLALHNFQCADCGPVKTKIISLTPKTDLRPSDVSDFDQTAIA